MKVTGTEIEFIRQRSESGIPYYAMEDRTALLTRIDELETATQDTLSVGVSIQDTELFQTMISYTQALIEILSEYDLSDTDTRKLNDISKDYFELIEKE